MLAREKKWHTILHFGTDRVLLRLRARSLKRIGYHVLNASDGFEAIKLAIQEPVDAVVLDLDRNHAEIALVASEIKRCRPQVPTIVLTEGTAPPAPVHELADALVPKRDNLRLLVTALEELTRNLPGRTPEATS